MIIWTFCSDTLWSWWVFNTTVIFPKNVMEMLYTHEPSIFIYEYISSTSGIANWAKVGTVIFLTTVETWTALSCSIAHLKNLSFRKCLFVVNFKPRLQFTPLWERCQGHQNIITCSIIHLMIFLVLEVYLKMFDYIHCEKCQSLIWKLQMSICKKFNFRLEYDR